MINLEVTTLGEVLASEGGFIRTGPFGSQLHQRDYVGEAPGAVPVVMPKDMADGRIDRASIAFIAPDTAARLSVHLLEAGDVLLARRGDLGRTAWIAEDDLPALCGTGSMRIHPGSSRLLPEYLRYLLRSPKVADFLTGHAVGATMPNLNADIVASLPIRIPPPDYQRGAAHILKSFDDLIENNRRRIYLIDEMANAFYREWFVQFRYPGHEDRGLVESPAGLVPDGWKVCKIGDVLELRYGKALKANDRRGGRVAVVGSSGIVGWHDERLVSGPAVVVGRKGNVGSVTWVNGSAWPIDTTYYVASDLPLPFVYEQLSRTQFVNSHAAVPGLSKEDAYSRPFLVPDDDVAERFADLWQSFSAERYAMEKATAAVTRLRDLLLPKLVDGQIEISALTSKGEATV